MISPDPSPTAATPAGEDAPFGVLTIRFDVADNTQWSPHTHASQELLWGNEGSLAVETAEGLFAVPAMMGLWIPAGVEHAVRAAGRTGFYCTHVALPVHPGLAGRTTAVGLTPLIRALILHGHENDMEPDLRRQSELLLARLLEPVATQAITLPLPRDERLAAICRHLIAHPDDMRSLEAWGQRVGGSARNLSRLFQRETGLTFEQWRLHARMRVAVALLASGEAVNTVSRRVGYRTPSAFVQAFRKIMGHTPGQYTPSAEPHSLAG
ncbi:helix-turn-helix transcriptional regulator [Mycetocola spongiae]|uniref:helix-turn-helix transcriptional regulator n=1 Tax=Mycetocola spongiae TaxID=2859226 RepID=UPI001CF3E951|nr:AraC family transcriptional regulator [Mycetocola spongiae]